jgi:hypothetical protein
MPFPGQKTPRGPFPLLPHSTHNRNIPGFDATVSSSFLSSPASPPSRVLTPYTPSNRRGEQTAIIPGVVLSGSNLFSRATKSRDPDFATWLSSPSPSNHNYSHSCPLSSPSSTSFSSLLLPHPICSTLCQMIHTRFPNSVSPFSTVYPC